ncbi:MAG: YhfC family glutamic-type intramembrane protease [Anaeromyxobacteraceae bacterium]
MPTPFVFSLEPATWAALVVAATCAFVLPIAAAFFWRHRAGASWRAVWVGVLVYFVSQFVLRIPWQVPLAQWVSARTGNQGPLFQAFLAFSFFTSGLFEETGRWVGYRYLMKDRRTRTEGVMMGIGHGGLEAVGLVGVYVAAKLAMAVLATFGLLGAERSMNLAAKLTFTPASALAAGGVERASAMVLHVGLSLVVLQAFRRPSGWRWVAAAIALHALANTAGFVALPFGTWAAEGVIAVVAAGYLWLGWRLASRDAPGAAAASPAPTGG